MRRMKDNYKQTFEKLEQGYKKLEAQSWERYKRNLNTWRDKAKERMEEYKSALKSAVDDWAYVENLLKEKLREEWAKNERLEKEKEAVVGSKGKQGIVDELKETYDQEIKLKEEELEKWD